MKQPLTLAAAALLLVACSDNPVAPAREASVAAMGPSRSVGAASAALDFTNVTNDMVSRLLPSFEDQTVAKSIETWMFELNAHAIAGEVAEAQSASLLIRTSLKEGAASALLLDVMNRTMDVIDRELGSLNSTETVLVLSN